jgi:hypothetical protein
VTVTATTLVVVVAVLAVQLSKRSRRTATELDRGSQASAIEESHGVPSAPLVEETPAVSFARVQAASAGAPGRVRLALNLPAGANLSAVSYVVQSSANTVLQRGTLPVEGPGVRTLSKEIVLPSGEGQTVTLVGTARSGSAARTVYLGRRTFEVVAGATKAVAVGASPATASSSAQADRESPRGAPTALEAAASGPGRDTLACQSCELSSAQPICDPPNITATSSTNPATGEQTGVGWGCGTLGSGPARNACLALLRCIGASACGRRGENPVMGCYCGTATPELCIGGEGVTGPCITEYQAAARVSPGAPAATATGGELSRFIATESSNPSTPVGLADNLAQCALDTECDACSAL